ncbi:MAG: assimilatory sulfite reductase (NADPH) flavoprotein subunit [Steroidobacterales bacterium]
MDAQSNALRRPLDAERQDQLAALLADLDPSTLTWVSGFVAGLAAERSRAGAPKEEPAAPRGQADSTARVLVLYASQTGNGRRVAERLGRSLEGAGLQPQVVAAGDYPARRLSDERLVYIVASTHGDGEAPDDARAFLDHLFGRRAPRLENLAYSVLALGDSSYPKFCATGRALDERFAELGARRLAPRVECDVDIEARAGTWLDQALVSARGETGAVAPRLSVVTPLRPAALSAVTRDNPLELELLVNQRVSARSADHDVRHLELALPDQRLDYEPGDALGLWVDNPAPVVDRVLELTGLDPAAAVTVDGATHSLRDWLTQRREVTRLARPMIEQLASRSTVKELRTWLEPNGASQLRAALKELQVADVLKQFAAPWHPEALVRALHPLSPRLYSIASSRREVGNEAHLTVAVVDYQRDGERRLGAASWQLATQQAGARLRGYVEPNPRFRVPADGTRDVIMVGPGTGVAPFRGFLQARVADGAPGRNWLFFGGRRRESDFLYQLEWLAALRTKQLHRLDVAFSRDQAHKIYVQDRMREHGAELFRWLEGGAHLYVCGDAQRMAPDVEEALVEIIALHGARSQQDAGEYVSELRANRRYARDVY